MEKKMNPWNLLLAIPVLLVLSRCSEGTSDKAQHKANNDHIWKEQTRAMERAKEVETTIMQAAKQRQEKIEQRTK